MLIEVKEIYAGYIPSVDILRSVNLKVKEGQITCVIGPNGCGKSTLLKTICGFLKPRAGKVLFKGRDITGIDPSMLVHLGVAYIPQSKSIFPLMSVEDNLKMGTWIFRKEPERVKMAMEEAYQRYPVLKEKRKMKAGDLSGGEQQMLQMDRALMIKPKIMILDEPTAGMAPKVASNVYKEIERLRDEGLTILLVDQNIKAAVSISDYVYVLESGRNRVEGEKESFLKQMEGEIKSWLV